MKQVKSVSAAIQNTFRPESAGARLCGAMQNKYINSIAHRMKDADSGKSCCRTPGKQQYPRYGLPPGTNTAAINMRTNNYWSSTEYSSTIAWNWNFNNSYANRNNKTNNNYVRCARR